MKAHFNQWSLSLLGSCETGLDLLTDANSLFLLLLVFAQRLVLVATVSSTLEEGGSCYFRRVAYGLSTESTLHRCSIPVGGWCVLGHPTQPISEGRPVPGVHLVGPQPRAPAGCFLSNTNGNHKW